MTFLDDFKGWLKTVQRGDGELLDWFLFLGIVAMITYLWTTVIRRVAD